jgi:hypothetical protein
LIRVEASPCDGLNGRQVESVAQRSLARKIGGDKEINDGPGMPCPFLFEEVASRGHALFVRQLSSQVCTSVLLRNRTSPAAEGCNS